MSLPGQGVAMISGASRGIGKAVALHLREGGWALSLGAREPDAIHPALAGEGMLRCPFDATDRTSERRWAEATAACFGRIDALVLNAGIMVPKSAVEVGDDELDALLEVNLKSPLRLARAAWPHLAASGAGRIVTLVSLSGKRVKRAQSGAYSISKFAALGLAHALRHAGFEAGIRSTALCPGFVATDMAAGVSGLPPGAMTQPHEIARIVALLLDLPNTASVAEVPVNCLLEEAF